MYKTIRAVAVLVCFLGTSQGVMADDWQVMNKDEIVSTFSGKTAWGEHAQKDKRGMNYYNPDGTWIGKRLDNTGSNSGKWYVDEENRLCQTHEDGDTRCRIIKKKGDKIRKYKGEKYVWKYTKFEDGDHVSK